MDIKPSVYIERGKVYKSTGQELSIKYQRGRKYIHFKGKQINVKSLPVIEPEKDYVFDYVFGGGFQSHPCPAMDYWIMRWRIKKQISIQQYKEKYLR